MGSLPPLCQQSGGARTSAGVQTRVSCVPLVVSARTNLQHHVQRSASLHRLPKQPPPPPRARASLKKVFELQPDIAWDKGKAVLWLLDKLVFPMSLEAARGSVSAAAITGGAGPPAAAAGRGAGGPSGQSGRAAAGSVDVAAAAAAALAANGAAGPIGGGGGGEEDEDDDDDEGEGSDRFFTIFIGDDKTDEVRESGKEQQCVPHRALLGSTKAKHDIVAPCVAVTKTPFLTPSNPTKNRGRLVVPPSSRISPHLPAFAV